VRVLALETATELVGAAVAGNDEPCASAWVHGRRRHAECLAPAVAHVLAQADLVLGDLDAVAVDVGPGLFTGLRVGVATAKALAQALGLGVLSCSSLEVLARAAVDAGASGPVLSVVDARRGEVFTAAYRPDPASPGGLAEVLAPARSGPEALGKVAAQVGAPLLVVGDGALRYGAALDGVAQVTLAPALGAPPPATLARLALDRLEAGVPTAPPGDVDACYLREPDVRINWVRRGRAPQPT
jgi:tRNA threonylcarbamoyladenosine biosynthesis protein TsaB